MKKISISIRLFTFCSLSSFSQSQAEVLYPKINGYTTITHLTFNIDKKGATYNFSNLYTVFFSITINVFKNEKYDFSFELVPFIKYQNDVVKVTSLLSHSGVIFKLKNIFSIVTRLVFETNGKSLSVVFAVLLGNSF